MTSIENDSRQLSQIYDKITQTLGYREATIHHAMYRRYQKALDHRELLNNKWFPCHILTIAHDTGYSKRQVKRAIRKLRRKKWLKIMDVKGYQTPLYQWLDDSEASLLELVSDQSQKVYAVIQDEYHYQKGFHNYVLDGRFAYSIKQVAASARLSRMDTKWSIKELRRKGLLEQQRLGLTTYFRLPKR